MSTFKFFAYLSVAIALIGCSNSEKNTPIEEEELLSFDVSTLDNKEYEIKLSDLMESVEIVQLDSSTEEAYTKIWKTEISEHYIATFSVGYPVKLFKRLNGLFLGNIGQIGQGPGEYNMVSEVTIDEEKGRIFVTETFKDFAYVYDLKGNFLKEETVYFPQNVIWKEGYFNKDNILVFILPYLAHETNPRFQKADKNVCWLQDRKGNIIQSISAEQYAMKVSISSQIYTAHLHDESPIYSFSIRDVHMHRADTIYHYDVKKNKMYPVYTTNIPSNKLCLVCSAESPMHFYTCQTKYKDGTEVNPWNVEHYKMIQVDKKTKEARYVRIKNDLLGGIDVPVVTFLLQMKDDMLWLHYDNLLDLKEQLKEALETNTDMSEEVRKRVVNMMNTLTEDSNDVLVICKFKKQ